VTEEEFLSALAQRGLLHDVVEAAQEHHCTVAEIGSKNRMAHVARARHAAMRKCRDKGLSYPAIGELFDRDHSSVMAALKRSA